jgi:cytochrome P450
MVHQLLNISSAKSYVPYQVLENKQMLYEILVKPDDFQKHIRRYANALTTTMVFGWRTPTYEDTKMKQLFEGFSEFAHLNATGVAALVDFFPLLRNLPDSLIWTVREARRLHAREKALYLSHWLTAKDAITHGTIKPCFCVGMSAAQKSEGFSDDQAAYISGTLLEAGSDTTSSTLYAFVQAMLLYPDVQRKAQKQLDEVVGDRMPTMNDEPKLHYVRACMKEVLRWMPTTILGAVPHAVTQDDYYEGYLIPKGAGVINNVWGIHMDPKRHPEPRRFIPERYENDTQSLLDAANNPDPTKRDQFSFGAGRRICPGIHVAERSLFLGISRMLWAFDISPKLDDQSQPILPNPDVLTQGFVVLPVEFPAQIRPRSASRADVVTREWEVAQEECLDPTTKQWITAPSEMRDITSKLT